MIIRCCKKGIKKWDSSDGSEGKFYYKGSWVQILVRKGFSLIEKTIFWDESQAGFEPPCWNTLIRYTLIVRVIKVPTENDMVYKFSSGLESNKLLPL